MAFAAEGRLTWAVRISSFRPEKLRIRRERRGSITPFMVLALSTTRSPSPCRARRWRRAGRLGGGLVRMVSRTTSRSAAGVSSTAASPDGRRREVLHFDRYEGAGCRALRGQGQDSCRQRIDPLRTRAVRLKGVAGLHGVLRVAEATGAGWVVPRMRRGIGTAAKEGARGAGRISSSRSPGHRSSASMEAFDQYWRKPPSVKRLIFRSVTEESTRLAMLKHWQADITCSHRGRSPRLQPGRGVRRYKPTIVHGTQWLNFVDQWDPKSPWADKRVRGGELRDRSQGHQPGTRAARVLPGSPQACISPQLRLCWREAYQFSD